MNRSEILFELERLMQLAQKSLSGSEPLDSLLEWDSLAILAYIARVQQRTGVVLDTEELSRARTIEDLIRLVPTSEAGHVSG